MTGAIDFLKHASQYCYNTRCKKCKFYYNFVDAVPECKLLKLLSYDGHLMEFSDLVREVEKWHRERSKDE